MLDINLLRNDPEKVRENIRKKFQDEKLPLVDEVIRMDREYRDAIQQGDSLRGRRKTLSKQIGGLLAKGQKEEAERNLRVGIMSSLNTMDMAGKSFASANEALESANKAYDIASKSYEVGRSTLTDLNDAQLALTQAQLAVSQAVYSFLTAKAALEQTLGDDYSMYETQADNE